MLISSMMHFNHFSKDLVSVHVWRQTQTQSTINNFYEEDMSIFKPRRNERGNGDGIYRMEFPLMQWLVACLYKVFGNHILITRIFMLLVGFLSVFGIYNLLTALFQKPLLAIFGAWAFNFSPCFYYYIINPIPDNFALCSAIWGLYLFFLWYQKNQMRHLVLSSILLSIGALCKLPFIIFFIIPCWHLFLLIIKNGINKSIVLNTIGALGFILLPMAWYCFVIDSWNGNIIIKGMLNNQASFLQLLDYVQHNLISTLPELLLNYGSLAFFILGFYFLYKNKSFKNPKFYLLLALSIITLLYYFFEANAIAKVHDYYLFPFYPLLFILVAYGAYHLYVYQNNKYKVVTLILIGLLPIICFLRNYERWDTQSPGFNADLLTYKKELQTAIPNNALVIVGNDESHFIFLYYVNKKGWGFDNDNFSSEQLSNCIGMGAKYMYTDSELLLKNKEIISHLDKLLLQKGSVKLYKLK